MARDTLRILLSMRRRSVEQARQSLAACLVAETEIADRIRSLDDAARRDREAGGSWPDAHQFLEMTAGRQEIVQAERRGLAADLSAAERHAAEAREVVSAARAAAEAVEELIGQRDAVSQSDATRREQHVLDDIARARLTLGQRR